MIGLIVAYSKNHVIGIDGHMPWNIPEELERFKELTTGNVIIMGRLTHKDIGRILPNRTNIIISNTEKFEGENCYTVSSLEDALKIAGNRDTYIIGGEQLFKDAIEFVDKMYITLIEQEFEGDRYFPDFDETKFNMIVEKNFSGDICYKYLTYIRKQ
ncbi:dihydrofolate reductase [Peptoanaerobacter stomatis]|jgi:dihydrofolate reductase|uniref:Dihydrofolate reductase n=1 Tax=Peptoanaerobacter stomatis TaxID=796937 RepID=G9X9X6_9FIRM|nr:dihydrofolate reductase [Peptoanaerobacter stomatis]EHL13176.1 dihydrofolate reductase [Peptoanaerobacter stomatis]EHL20222.1 dihydrofolate reductase [Peptoanaerobacter stomatis]